MLFTAYVLPALAQIFDCFWEYLPPSNHRPFCRGLDDQRDYLHPELVPELPDLLQMAEVIDTGEATIYRSSYYVLAFLSL